MDPISGLAALGEMLRRQRNAKAGRERGATSDMGAAIRTPSKRVEFAELERQLRVKLSEQARDSPPTTTAKRQVIASLLSWELDPRLQNEPKFNALVRNIQQSIEGDARLKAKFEDVMNRLSR